MSVLLELKANNILPTTVVDGYFPNAFLEANGYENNGYNWDNNLLYHSIECNSGFIIYVVDNAQVWIERFGKLDQLHQVITGIDLLDLERLLG